MSVAATIAEPESPRSSRFGGERRWVIEDVRWDDCEELSKLLPPAFRLAFDRSRLEMMVTSQLHDHYADVLDTFFKAVAGALRIRFLPYRIASWTRPEIQRSIQADNSYYLTQAKIDAGLAGTARKSKDAGDYPNPDLAIEVDLSPPKVDREGIYAALKVAELWTFNGTKLTISRLGKNGRCRAVQQSGFPPLRVADIFPLIVEEDQSDYDLWTQLVRAWAKTSLKGGRSGRIRRGSQ